MNSPDLSDAAPVGFEIDVPAHWPTRRDLRPFALVARPSDRRAVGGFGANLTVLDAWSGDGTTGLDRYAAAQLAAIAGGLHDALLVSAEGDVGADGSSTLDLLIAHDVNGHAVTLRQRHLLHPDGRALIASASVADVDWPDLGAMCSAAVCSLRMVGP